MKRRLPLAERPPMIANQYMAFPLSIIFTAPERYEPLRKGHTQLSHELLSVDIRFLSRR